MKTLQTLKPQVKARIKQLENTSVKNANLEEINSTLEILRKILSLLPPNRKVGQIERLVKPKHTKAVYQYDGDGFLIGEFKSINLASEASGVRASSISNYLTKRYNSTRNKEGKIFTWKYKQNEKICI